jgi:tetratricopeptide (TPR) repeat protein
MYADACGATYVRGEQPSEVMNLRMTCLDRPLASLRALTDVLSQADGAVLAQAVNATQALPPIDRCADVPALRASGARPPDAAVRPQVDALRIALTRVQALSDTGRWKEARHEVEAITEEARRIGYEPLVAEALQRLGWLQYFMGDMQLASDSVEEAVWAAVASQRDDLALDGASLLFAVTGYHLRHRQDAARWGRLGWALLRRLGAGNERAEAWLLHNRGFQKMQTGDYDGALIDFEAGLAIKRRILPPNHPDIGIVIEAIANLQTDRDPNSALERIREARAIFEKAYGASSPLLARTLGNLGEIEHNVGDDVAAEKDLRASIDRYRQYVPADHPWVAYPLTALGQALVAERRAAEGIPPLERALRIRQTSEANRTLLADTSFALARALRASDTDPTRARALASAALAIYRDQQDGTRRATEVSRWLAR